MAPAAGQPAGVQAGTYRAEIALVYTITDGLPDNDVHSVAIHSRGDVYAATSAGLARFVAGRWQRVEGVDGAVEVMAVSGEEVLIVSGAALHRLRSARVEKIAPVPPGAGIVLGVSGGPPVLLATSSGLYRLEGDRFTPEAGLRELLGPDPSVRQVAVGPGGEVAVAAAAGLFVRDPAGRWSAAIPADGARSWAPRDVRGVAYDSRGRLWFGSPQGVGCRDSGWRLYTGAEGLPYDDFTVAAAGEDGVIWFGTRAGAIRFDGRTWEYRQGRRWLPDDQVRGIAVNANGDAWFATARGAGVIERRPTTLWGKATFFESEIDKRHRRTEYEYVLGVALKRPGDKSEWVQHDSDNDGLWTAMYGAGECFAFAATGSEEARRRAKAAFEAMRFLGTVTQGGQHPAPRGFVARTVLPTSGPNPNLTQYTRERDEQTRATRDAFWKVIVPRWPVSADGKWYWKTDTSSDELDGHYFLYARYYDLVATEEAEKQRVREHVAALTDHLIEHDFQLVDHDGKPTRWAVFGPEKLNRDPAWSEERGLNSLSILSYLKVAEHITGQAKYREAARMLIEKHNYDINVLIPKTNAGPGSGNQSDDEMAFMCFYNLLGYETDPRLRQIYGLALRQRWEMENYELNPLFNFIAAASLQGVMFKNAFGEGDLSLKGSWLEESVDTLQRFPLDRIDWRLRNSHRKDVISLPDHAAGPARRGQRGSRRDGRVLPIDERYVDHWNHDPWQLDQGGEGRYLADGASYLLPYYTGLYHRFVAK